MQRDIDLAVITYYDLPNLADEDQKIFAEVQNKMPSARIEVVVWDSFESDTQVKEFFSRVKVTVIRTPWDYVEKFAKFEHWLTLVNNSGTKLLNSYATIIWNSHKTYLKNLRDNCGVKIVPTHFFNCDESDKVESPEELLQIALDNNWETLILKPCRSNWSRRITKCSREQLTDDVVREIISSKEPYMLQPFASSIESTGEVAYVFFNGQFTHAVKKNLEPGSFDWKSFGPEEPTKDALELAYLAVESAAKYAEPSPSTDLFPNLYTRIDLLEDADGGFMVSELEALEPDLYIRYSAEEGQQAIDTLASAICNWVQIIE